MVEAVIDLLKARLGISTSKRDDILCAIIDGIVSDCKETHGIELKAEIPGHVMLVLDWATWKYNHPEDGVTPRSIQFRVKNLIVKKACEDGTNVG